MNRSAFVLILVASCSSSTIPPATDRLSVDVALYVIRDGHRIEVPPNGQVHSNEVFQFEVAPSRASYLHVGLRHDDGTTEVLFPDRTEQILVNGGKMTIPSASSDIELAFDDRVGTESLVVIASLKPLSAADAAAAGLTFAEDDGSAAGSAVPEEPAHEAVEVLAVDAGVPADAGAATHQPAPQRTAQGSRTHRRVLPITSNNRIARGVLRRTKHPVIDADDANVVVFPYVVDHVR